CRHHRSGTTRFRGADSKSVVYGGSGCQGLRPCRAGRRGAVVACMRQHGHVPRLCTSRAGVCRCRGRARIGQRGGCMSLFADLTSSVNAVRPGRTTMPSFVFAVIIASAALVLFGLLMVYSASIALADGPRYESYGRYYFVMRHGLFLVLGVLALGVALSIPMRVWQKAAVPLF